MTGSDIDGYGEMIRFDRSVVKPEAIARLAERLREDGQAPPSGPAAVLNAALNRFGPTFNRDVNAVEHQADQVRLIHPAEVDTVLTPAFPTGRPDAFPPMEPNRSWEIRRPAYERLRTPNATLRLIPDAPVVFKSDREVIRRFSSEYWQLLHFYEEAEAALNRAPRRLDGLALVMIDDVWGLNYCHWLVDWLPRLSLLGDDVAKAYVLTSPLSSSFQVETLVRCGVSPDRIVPMAPWDAVQADELIAQPYTTDIIHPGFRGADWAMGYVRRLFLEPSESRGALGRRLYLSRSDAVGRRVVNEAALEALLARYGYESVTTTGLTVQEQASMFSQAAYVIALHGAGLTNVVFASPEASLVEIFAATYGTPAFWILAASRGQSYVAYVADEVHAGPRAQLDDVGIDLARFEGQVLQPLHGAQP